MKSILLYEPDQERHDAIASMLSTVIDGEPKTLTFSTTQLAIAKIVLKEGLKFNLIICGAEKRSELSSTQSQNFIVYYDSLDGIPDLALQILNRT